VVEDQAVPVSINPTPAFYQRTTSSGLPFGRFATMHGGYLALSPVAECQFLTSADRCRFCSLDGSIPGQGTRIPVEDVIDAAAASYEHVVLDLGVAVPDDPLLKRVDHAVLAVDGSAVGVVRGARLVAEWAGPPPALILNRVEPSDRSQIIDAAKKWTGLEPLAVLPSRPRIRSASLEAKPPDRKLRRMLDGIRVNR